LEGYSLSEISEWICADKKLFGTIEEIVTDSRKITPNCLFIALEGEFFDGHRFISEALEKGAAAAVAHKKGEEPQEKTLYVGNTERALRALARMRRIKIDPVTVGITGSVGKTTTREMIAAVVRQKYRTLTTKENLNNNVGMPQTLLQLTPEHQAAVIEMGMTAQGEIEELTTTLLPRVGVITNIGVSHIERLGSRENIRQAKLEIVQGLREGSPLFLNGDDPMLWGYHNPHLQVIFYGIDNKDCQITAKDLVVSTGSTTFTICFQGEKYPARIPCMGPHNVCNALAAFGVGVYLGMEPKEAAAALNQYQVTGWRQKITQFRGFTVVEDCYNAGPESMAAALTTLGGMPCAGRRIAVLADMLELGHLSDQAHRTAGARAGLLGLDAVYAYGEKAKLLVEEAQKSGVPDTAWFPDKKALTEHVIASVKKGDILWVKGSHGMALETLIEAVYQKA
jgi:UDP-N-acetylmuramoyl-tripeptide--D-alanyl-D-alanine ligase